jgi:asparagine synthase (glutamine-hydrolysing)
MKNNWSFIPSRRRNWQMWETPSLTLHLCGWAYRGDDYLSGKQLSDHIVDQMQAALPWETVFSELNGNFAVVIGNAECVVFGVDAVRSIPLIYRSNKNSISISDCLFAIRQTNDAIDPDSLIEFCAAGYVTGSHTLYENMTALKAGEYGMYCREWNRPDTKRYFRYDCAYDSQESEAQLCEEFNNILISVFCRLTKILNGRQVVIPLSGGLDSRLVASMCKQMGYENVLCFSYGLPDNIESARSEKIAQTLGYPWIRIPYTGAKWKDTFSLPAFHEYFKLGCNGISLPHIDDWPATQALRSSDRISEDAVFVPGHTGDFICGSHLKYVFDPVWHDDPRDLLGALIKKHYMLWKHLLHNKRVKAAIEQRIHEIVREFPNTTPEDIARMYEFWEWQERQSKYIINAVRVYEFFSFDWRIPLWDRDIMNFWKEIPLEWKFDKYLYRTYLANYDAFGIFPDVNPVEKWYRESTSNRLDAHYRRRIKQWLKSSWLLSQPFDYLESYRYHLRTYWSEPKGISRGYGFFPYVFGNRTKRHSTSLLIEPVLNSLGLDAEFRALRYGKMSDHRIWSE